VTNAWKPGAILKRVAIHGTLLVGGILFSLPFLWLLSASFKGPEEMFAVPMKWIPSVFTSGSWDPRVIFQNFISAENLIPFWLWMWNTAFVTGLNVVLNVASSSFIAFGFSRIRWRGRELVFFLVLATLMLPAQVTMIPVFLIFNWMGMYNTLTPLWLGSLFGNAFHIFLLRQFMLTLPQDLDDAAKIDGCSYLRVWSTITIPLVKPALAVVAVQTFQGSWNNFRGPFIYINSTDKMTFALGLQWFRSEQGRMYGEMMATSLMMTVPVIILFFFCQRYMIQGITLSGMKE
jgi:multiple sugar transport system permease protein